MKGYVYLLFLTLAVADAAEYRQHRVEVGETLSQILYSYNLKPIYSKDGSLVNTIFYNQLLIKENGNFILPGQIIRLVEAGKIEAEDVPVTSELHEPAKNKSDHQTSKEEKQQDRNTLTLSFISGYLGVAGEDQATNGGEILSKLYFGVGAKWRTNLTEDYSLSFFGDYKKVEIEDTTNTTLTNRDQDLKEIGISVDRDFSWLSLTSGYNFIDQIYYRTASLNSFKVLTMINNQIYLEAVKEIFELENTLISIGLNTNFNSFNAPSGVDISSGFGYGGYLKYQKQISGRSLAAILSYDTNSFESNDTNMDFKSLNLRFDYEFDFFKGDSI